MASSIVPLVIIGTVTVTVVATVSTSVAISLRYNLKKDIKQNKLSEEDKNKLIKIVKERNDLMVMGGVW